MNNFNLENYDLVVDRISEFYKRYPNGVIITEILSDMAKIHEYVVMRAKLWLLKEDYESGKPPMGVGHAMEIAGSHGASKFSWLENAEQSSIGRALAARDVWIKRKGASESEMRKAQLSQKVNDNMMIEDKLVSTQRNTNLGPPFFFRIPNGASDSAASSSKPVTDTPAMVLAGNKYGKPTVKQVVFVEKSLERIGMITPGQKKDYLLKVTGYDHLRDWKDVDAILKAIRSQEASAMEGKPNTGMNRMESMDDDVPFPDDNDGRSAA